MKRTVLRRHTGMLSIGLALLISLAACGDGGSQAGEEGPTVVATTTVLGDIVENVVGDAADVVVLTPVGVDPHDFQASAAQVAQMNQADLVVANGLGLEEGLEDVLEAVANDGVEVLSIGPLVDPLPFDGDHDGHGHGDDEDGHHDDGDHESGLDPHVWLDPVRMAGVPSLIAGALDRVAPGVDWERRAEMYAAELMAAHATIAATLEVVESDARKLVTNHDSLGYFADRYGFETIGTVLPGGSTLGDPSSEDLAALVGVMRREGVTVIFGESTRPTELADAVAAELGSDVAVVELFTGSLGDAESGAGTLIGLLMTNAERIADALAG